MVSRYGPTIRKREETVLRSQQARYPCPSCGKTSLKRISNALWQCKSCGAKLAGGAYVPETPVGASSRKFLESVKQG